MNYKSILPILAAMTLIVASCASSRQESTAQPVPYASSSAPVLDQSVAVGAYETWQDVKIPIKVSLTSPSSLSASGTMIMQRDRSVHISLKILGFEVAVLYITPDTVYALDKYHKYMLKQPIAALTKMYGVSLGNIQSLLLGKAFIPGSNYGATGEAIVNPTGDKDLPMSVIMTPIAQSSSQLVAQSLRFIIDTAPTTQLLATLIMPTANAISTTIEYENFVQTTYAGNIPSKISMPASGLQSGVMSAELELTPGRAKWNTGAAPSWKTPSGYKTMSLTDLMKSLGK